MPVTASFINWNNDPLTRIPSSRARDRSGLHPKGCRCRACGEMMETAKDLLRSNIGRLSDILRKGRPDVLDRENPTATALYHVWFDLRFEFIREVEAGRLDYPPKVPDEIQKLRRACGEGQPGVWIPPGLSKEALEATAVLVRCLAWREGRSSGAEAGAGINERQFAGSYRQPKRITDFHEGRNRGRAMAARGSAAYRTR
jgi:hypothetical protein